jgi:signal transduction histidine kinase/ligand-binding sensor domain-containing protein
LQKLKLLPTPLVLVCLTTLRAGAQVLPLQHYTTSDGLAHNVVTSLYEDSRGYLWIGTVEGASRFDGETFTTYGRRHTLPTTLVTRFLETPDGQLLVATSPAGVFRLNERASTFERISIADDAGAQRVISLAVTERSLWAATDAGLYRGSLDAPGVAFERVIASDDSVNGGPSLTDSRGRVWASLRNRVVRLGQPARVVHEMPASPERPNDIVALLEDAHGALLAVSLHGAMRRETDDAPFSAMSLPLNADEEINAAEIVGETLWLGTSQALLRVEPGRVVRYTAAHGIPPPVVTLLRSRSNQLWIGTTTGLHVLLREGNFGARPPEGEPVLRVLPTPAETIAATARGLMRVSASAEPSRVRSSMPGVGARIAKGPHGSWWLATDDAIFVAPGSPSAPARRLGAAHGIAPGVGVFEAAGQETAGMHADAAGVMWIALADDRLYRCEVAADITPACVTIAHQALSWRNRPVTITDDGAGTLWVAAVSGLGRLRDGTFELIQAAPSAKARMELTPALLIDSRRRLWVGTHHQGVALSRAPGERTPQFEMIDTERGLSSDAVYAITEGKDGVMYVATGRGLDAIRFADSRVDVAPVELGFETGQVHDVAVSGHTLWVAAVNGVYWHNLDAPAPRDLRPHVLLRRLMVRGEEWPLPERGLERIGDLSFPPGAEHLQIEFLAPHVGLSPPRYQYRLSRAQSWSPPSAAHEITLTGLRPGAYTFEVQAVTATGVTAAPATMQFELRAPVWQRWWFRTLVALLIVAAAIAAHRLRLRHVLALERVRSQIAADLHDDIGSRLAEMAMVSELGVREGDPPSRDRFTQLAATARDVRQTMSDVVWAIDPRRDHLIDLIGRTRQAAEALLGPDVSFQLNLPSPDAVHRITLGLDQRRQIVLIIREALVNVQKHAHATSVVVTFALDGGMLRIVVEDNGVGINDRRGEGYGVGSMERRAAALGGTVQIGARPGAGTVVTLTLPLKRRRQSRVA